MFQHFLILLSCTNKVSLQQLFGLKENRGKKSALNTLMASCVLPLLHKHVHTHNMWKPSCCGASKLIVKFSHGGTQYHLSYPLYRTPSETSSVHSPSITRLLFTLFLKEHGHGSPHEDGKPTHPSCNLSVQTTHLINWISMNSGMWHGIMLIQL